MVVQVTILKMILCLIYVTNVKGVQISKLMPLDIIYAKSHGSGVVGKVWKEHHSAFFAEFVLELTNNDKSILEIGGGHGFLSSFALRKELKIGL